MATIKQMTEIAINSVGKSSEVIGMEIDALEFTPIHVEDYAEYREAAQAAKEATIPALVIDVNDEDAFIMSLAENIARRQCRPLELLAGIEQLKEKGYNAKAIAAKTGGGPPISHAASSHAASASAARMPMAA